MYGYPIQIRSASSEQLVRLDQNNAEESSESGAGAARYYRRYSAAEDEAILQYRRAGYKWAGIGSKLGRSAFSVRTYFSRHLKHMEIPDATTASGLHIQTNARKLYTEKEDNLLLAWIANPGDRKIGALARDMGRSTRSTVSRVEEIRSVNHRSPAAESHERDLLGRRWPRRWSILGEYWLDGGPKDIR